MSPRIRSQHSRQKLREARPLRAPHKAARAASSELPGERVPPSQRVQAHVNHVQRRERQPGLRGLAGRGPEHSQATGAAADLPRVHEVHRIRQATLEQHRRTDRRTGARSHRGGAVEQAG